MTTLPPHRTPPNLFLRLWEGQRLTPTLARHVLKLGWSVPDEERMRDLAARNAAGTISVADRQELDDYIEVGLTLSILHSRARKVLDGRVARAGRD